MRILGRNSLAYLILLVQIYISCEKLHDGGVRNQPIPIVVARAGADQIVVLPADSTILDGDGSFSHGGKIVSYHWQKLEGSGGIDMIGSESQKVILKKLELGAYKFSLTVTDDQGRSAADTISVAVYNGPDTTFGSIMEYGTDKPVDKAHVFVSICSTPGGYDSCKFIDTVFIADEQGKFSFKHFGFLVTDVVQTGYWNSADAFVAKSFPQSADFNYGVINFCDSFVIKMVPQTKITIHLKDSTGIRIDPIDRTFDELENGGMVQSMNPPYGDLHFSRVNAYGLNYKMDTIIQLIVYGNADNTFTVHNILNWWDDDNGVGKDTMLFSQTWHIVNGASTALNITY
ncbi:MAG: PKD domain-containing protein [Chitinophagales bacterium]